MIKMNGKIIELDKKYVADTYARFPVELVSGKGSLLYGADGKEYIDMGSGIGVTAFGISDDVWADAVSKQLNTLNHTSNLYYTEPCAKLAELLCLKTGMKKVFFSNSGAEANECAIKAARKYAQTKKGAEYSAVITLKNSFHGRTLTTLSATGQEHYHELYQPLTPGFYHASDIDEVVKLVHEHPTAGIMIECIQGEGGVLPIDEGFIRDIYELSRSEDIVMIVDEVQTGNGRTGALYSYMNYGITPDIVTTAKGLGGGLPIGATLLGERVRDVFGHGDHGSTFGANPICCAGALSILNRLDDEFLENVRKKGRYVFDRLNGASGVLSVSGMGLMIGVETKRPAAEIVNECMKRGVLCLTAKHKVRFLPALNIPTELLERAIDIFTDVCKETAE